MSIRDKLKEIIRELIRNELAEVSVTGGIDGGEGPPKTPFAFGKKKKKKKENESTSNSGYTKVNEGKYHDYRNDDTMSPKQKIGRSMREVRDGLNHLEKLVKMNVRLKNELSVNSDSYWKNTHKALHKISERLVKLANKVGQLQ